MVFANVLRKFRCWYRIQVHDVSDFQVVDPVVELADTQHIPAYVLIAIVFPELLNVLLTEELFEQLLQFDFLIEQLFSASLKAILGQVSLHHLALWLILEDEDD